MSLVGSPVGKSACHLRVVFFTLTCQTPQRDHTGFSKRQLKTLWTRREPANPYCFVSFSFQIWNPGVDLVLCGLFISFLGLRLLHCMATARTNTFQTCDKHTQHTLTFFQGGYFPSADTSECSEKPCAVTNTKGDNRSCATDHLDHYTQARHPSLRGTLIYF